MHKFSPEIEEAILAEVTRSYAVDTVSNLCDVIDDCTCCPYIQVLGKHCGTSDALKENECLIRAHQLIEACGLELPRQSSISSSEMWDEKRRELSSLLVNGLHDWSKRTGTIFISSLKSTDVRNIVDDILENIFSGSANPSGAIEDQESGHFECDRIDVVRLPKKETTIHLLDDTTDVEVSESSTDDD